MKNRKIVSRLLSVILSAAMMASLAISASATTAGIREADVTAPQDGPVGGICSDGSIEPAKPDPDPLSPPPKTENPPLPSFGTNQLLPEITTSALETEVEPPPVGADTPDGNTSVTVDAEQLFTLVEYLRNTYYLEARITTLIDYSQFDPKDGYFVFKNGTDIPKSICDQLNGKDRQAICQLSTYQAYLYIQQTDTYKENAALQAQVDKSYAQFMEFMPGAVRESLTGFAPSAITSLLNPDQLCVFGDAIISTEAYQNLKDALSPVKDCYAAEQIEKTYAPAEITLLYDEISRAAMKIWPNGSDELHLGVGVRPDGSIVLIPLPTQSADDNDAADQSTNHDSSDSTDNTTSTDADQSENEIPPTYPDPELPPPEPNPCY